MDPGQARDDNLCPARAQDFVIAGLTRNPGCSDNASMQYFVYLMASRRIGTIYVGVTNDLVRRVYEHKNDLVEGFTQRYAVHLLVWFDSTSSIEAAITKEKQIKNWKREWKVALIEKANPEWLDLYEDIL
jgi:putative endonuclease